MFFVRGVIETVRKLRWDPTVIHCTGWITALAPLYIRHLYQDDPGLSRSLVVYSLRPESFEGKLDARFAEKLKMAGFTDECLQSLGGGDFDWMTLNKLGIDHSDAIVVTTPDIPAGLVEYARQSGKPVLEYPGSRTAKRPPLPHTMISTSRFSRKRRMTPNLQTKKLKSSPLPA